MAQTSLSSKPNDCRYSHNRTVLPEGRCQPEDHARDRVTEESKSILKSIFSTERIAVISANELLVRLCGTGTVGSKGTVNSSNK
ncbi:hypothetical protein quinque_002620 [Culex quinquefasciatus]